MRQIIFITLGLLLFSCKGPGAQPPPGTVVDKADTAMRKMPDSLKDQIAGEIKLSVKSGFYSSEETLDNVNDVFSEDSLDEPWIRKRINKAFVQAFNAQVSWPAVTSFDKLALAFDKLNEHHIIALHNQGMTKEDGVDDCTELHDKLKKKGISTRGYCFYHGQDVERVVEDKVLYIAFGDFGNNDRKGVEIGRAVVKALKEQGFKVSWNNKIDTRIEITNFIWRKRFGNGNCSYDRAVRLLGRR
jgi:hypothetical protein